METPQGVSLRQAKTSHPVTLPALARPVRRSLHAHPHKVDTVQVFFEQMSHLYSGVDSEVYF